MKEKSELARIAIDSGQNLFVDRTGKHQSRGAYVCRSFECIAKAKKQKGIERSIWQRKHEKGKNSEGGSANVYEQLAETIRKSSER